MYLFSRMRTARASHLRKALALATEARDFVSEHSGLDVSLHMSVAGRPVGTMTWATLVEGRAQLTEATGKLMANPEYLDLVERSAECYEGNGEDFLRQIVHMRDIDTEAGAPMFSQGWAAQITNGQFDHAMTWAVDIAEYLADSTDIGIATLADAYGPFGTVTWIATLDNAQRADEVNEQLMADAEWIKRLNYAEDLFIAGSGRSWLNRRVD